MINDIQNKTETFIDNQICLPFMNYPSRLSKYLPAFPLFVKLTVNFQKLVSVADCVSAHVAGVL